MPLYSIKTVVSHLNLLHKSRFITDKVLTGLSSFSLFKEKKNNFQIPIKLNVYFDRDMLYSGTLILQLSIYSNNIPDLTINILCPGNSYL